MGSRTDRRRLRTALPAALLFLLAIVPAVAAAPQAAGPSPHEAESALGKSPQAFTAAQMERIRNLEGRLMCACPDENWSRTLSNCMASCADPQKRLIRKEVAAGKSDDEIIQGMVNQYGPQVLSAPPWRGIGLLTYLSPFLVLGVGIWLVARFWRHGHDSREGGDPPARRSEDTPSEEELRRVEQELERLD